MYSAFMQTQRNAESWPDGTRAEFKDQRAEIQETAWLRLAGIVKTIS